MRSCRLRNFARLAPLAALAILGACATSSHRAARMAAWRAASGPPSALGATGTCASDGAVPTLDLRSSFWLNLHDFLVVQAKRRRGVQDESPGAFRPTLADTVPARPLTTAERARWTRALDTYDRAMRESMRVDSVLVMLNVRLAEAAEYDELPDVVTGTMVSADLAAALREAAPVYREVWWPTHDRQNRAWIAATRARLDRDGACLLRREAALFGRPWPGAPVPVEASVYATWFGAYTTLDPVQITVSSASVGTQGANGLEVLLHEAGHTILGAVDSALAASAARQHRRLPSEMSHLVLFYTAGALVRSVDHEHVPYAQAFGIWRQNAAARRYFGILERAWWPYLDGSVDFASAIDAVVRELDPG